MQSTPGKNRIALITGASGFLGWHMMQRVPAGVNLHAIIHKTPITDTGHFTAHSLDLTNFKALPPLLDKINPDAIIHLAAVSDSTRCEQKPNSTRPLNVEAARQLAAWCAANHRAFVFASSDLVFDGEHAPYAPHDAPHPVNEYGRQKLAAETGIRQAHPGAIIARLPLMYGEGGPGTSNTLTTMVQTLRSGKRLTLFTDEFRTPAYAGDVGRFLWKLTEGAENTILHLGGPEPISRYDMGMLVANTFDLNSHLVMPGKQEETHLPAPRPRDVSMDIAAARALGFSPRPMKVILPKLKQYV